MTARDAAAHGDGSPAVDPTLNVKEGLAAAVKRIDDIREADRVHAREIRELEVRHANTEERLRERLEEAESRRIDALSMAEARRLDALRAEDRSAVTLANTRAELTATNLQAQVVTTERTLAASADATAKALATAFETAIKVLGERVAPLEQARYQAAGNKESATEGKQDNRWVIGVAMALPSFVLAAIALAVVIGR